MRETKTVNNCFSVGDLTFALGEDQYMGLGSVSFTVIQDVINGVDTRKALIGVFAPKDDESAFKLAEAFDKGKDVAIQGRFRDTLNDNQEADWTLTNVLFDQIKLGGLSYGTFHAVPSEYPLGTFTRE